MSIKPSELKSQPIFNALDEAELQQVCDAGVVQLYNKGEYLIREGSLNHFLFFIAKGSVAIKSYGVKVATLSAGELIGEVSAAGLGSTIADVIASGSVTVYKLPSAIINKISAGNRAFGESLHDKAMARVLR